MQACQHYTGAELASIHNEDENKFIRWYLHQKNAHAAHRAYWIGLIVKGVWLTHLSLDKMAAISQTTFSYVFFEWKVLCFD